jgi:outer membrane receptor protein involved in Fe transport
MIKKMRYLALTVLALVVASFATAQVTIKGNVKNGSNESIGSVNVTLKGTSKSTYTDPNGNFQLSVPSLPAVLIFSSVGYESQELSVDNNTPTITMNVSVRQGEDIVISASRVPQKILEAPVSIERVSASNIKNASAASFYDLLQNLKGVDLMASSLTFKTPTTRGFNGSGNARFTQITDGIDNQAPGLNFSVGSVIGLSELDVDNMELLPGASSALYGPGGMNGTLIINSKNPFKYQGLSMQVKTGIMHTDRQQRANVGGYNNWAIRYAKKFSDKFAAKITTELIQAKDWVGNDYRNYNRLGTTGSAKAGNRMTDPNYDGINVYGDETNTSAIGGWGPLLNNFSALYGSTAINNEIAANSALGISNVSRTGYKESDIIDPNTVNYKIGGSLNYKITDNTEAIIAGNWGTGNTVYTGSDRYSLQDLKIGQYKVELVNKKWFLRAATTQENSGNSFNSTVATRLTHELLLPSSTWFPTYATAYLSQRFVNGLGIIDAHNAARAVADANMPRPGSVAYKNAFNIIRNKPIGADPVKAGGGKFLDKSDLYNFDGQYNLSSITNGFADLLIGANYRTYVLNSQGTLFADSADAITINEVGAYLQASKNITEDFKVIVSGRYDKNQNFKGRFTPRATATYRIGSGNLRASFQTAYRFPTTQQQWINLDVGSTRLLGSNPSFRTFYNFNTNPTYTLTSVQAGAPVKYNITDQTPESVTSYELGYKALVMDKKLLIDVYGYFGQYQNFTVRTNVIQPKDGNVANIGNSANQRFFSIPANDPGNVRTYGWGFSADYRFNNGYYVSSNVSSDVLSNVSPGLVAFFNSPKYRANVSLGNNSFGYKKRIGFNATYRWQDAYFFEGDFANGQLPAVQTVDAMFSYKLPAAKTIFKLGANNLLNQYYRSGFANPMMGGLYYVGIGYNL